MLGFLPRNNLRSSLRFGLFAVPMFLALVGLTVDFLVDRSHRHADYLSYLTTINEARAATIDRTLAEYHRSAHELATFESVRAIERDGRTDRDTVQQIERLLDAVYRESSPGEVALLAVWDADGRVVASTDPDLVGVPVPRDYVRRLRDEGGFFAGHERFRSAEEDFLAFVEPVEDDGEFVGGVAVRVGGLVIDRLIAEAPVLGETGETYVVRTSDLRMTTTSRFKSSARLHEIVDTRGARAARDEGAMSGAYPDYRGVPVLGAARRLKGAPWLLLTEIDQSEVDATGRDSTITAVSLAVVLALLVGFIGWGRVERIVTRIEELQEGVRDVARGDLDTRIAGSAEYADELEGLADGFNEMVATMQRTQATVHSARLRYEHVFEGSVDAIVLMEAGHIVDANRAAHELFGPELVGRPLQELVRMKELRQLEVLHALEAGQVARVETVGVRSDGSRFPLEASVTRIVLDDVRITQVVFRDVTETKRAEAELYRAKLEAEEANRVRSAFLANMSHEIRTPMHAILGFAHMLSEDESLGGAPRRHASVIARSGQRLLELLDDVLDMSSLEADRIHCQAVPTELAPLFDAVGRRLTRETSGSAVATRVVTSGLPRAVAVDRPKLHRILGNLASNATKFTTEGSIEVRAEIDSGDERDWLVVQMQDTGPGIDEDHLQTIFEPFKRSENSSASTGTGLGLALARRLARLMGGDVTVVTERGVGSTFELRVPVEPVAGAALSDGSKPTSPPSRGRVLVIDDEEANREVITRFLDRRDVETTAAASADEAFELLERDVFDLVLLDLRLPVVDGAEILRRIRSDARLDHLQVVMVSGVSREEVTEALGNLTADGFLRKPFRPAELEAATLPLLDRAASEPNAGPAQARTEPDLTSPLASLAESTRRALSSATIEGDPERIFAVIDDIAATEPTLADALRDLADRFEYQTILDHLEGRLATENRR